MSILPSLSENFPQPIQERGDEYFNQHRVKIVENRPGYIRAIVRGTGRYRVEITFSDGDFLEPVYRCGCPYFEDHSECKHVWATLRQAESQALLPTAQREYATGGSRSAAAVDDDKPDEADAEADDGTDDEAGDDDWELEQTVENEIARPSRPPRDDSTDDSPDAPRKPRWLRTLENVKDQMIGVEQTSAAAPWPAQRRVVYVVDVESTGNEGQLTVELMSEDLLGAGKVDRLKPLRLSRLAMPKLPDPADAQIVQMLLGAGRDGAAMEDYLSISNRFVLGESSAEPMLRRMIATERCRLRHRESSITLPTLQFDDGAAWKFVLRLQRDEREPIFWLRGDLRRGEETIDAGEAAIALRGGLLIRGDTVSRLEDGGAYEFIQLLRGETSVFIPELQMPQLLGELFTLPRLPTLDLPEGFAINQNRVAPRPRLTIGRPTGPTHKLSADLNFDYAAARVPWRPAQPAVFDPATKTLIWRDRDAEASAAILLSSQGLRPNDAHLGDDSWRVPAARLGKLVGTLVAAGWVVEAEGKIYRRGGKFNVRVASGIDWLELTGDIDFDGQSATLPQLLAAARSGDKLVKLGDGTFGVLPEDWLSQYGLLAAMGEVDGEQVKFSKKQVGLLDALLASIPEATWDESFAKLRSELEEFNGIQAAEAPAEFSGELRHYQKDGLGWIGFLRRFSFGGCLADDMGLGKTIQVLAMLQQRKTDGAARPTLVVVPRSLIFNWVNEAQKFTPGLRVLDHSGAQRSIPDDQFANYDIVLSTYGTVRRDAVEMKDIAFDYVILDEAQAIKNNQSESAKAVRLLKSDYRLALSGTPVQNHLGELWSLFEFLNPGLLGTAGAFRTITTAGPADAIGRDAIARALRPFILRRTKSQVAPELPDKLEQTLVCELDREQRRLYNELREHYRNSLLQQVDQQGIGKSKMQILEALLRLRQAACHPGLIDKKRIDEPSAKLDALVPQLEEVLQEDHKVLVFSQFTSFLAILRKKLDAKGITYEYLDGKTTDRQSRVRRFQNDADCKLFLISLKAGGLGLNLTAAEYVFLLDPWWNPAVEQQAIDRTHRIGQTRQVFAYRLIARDTVEEKVLELQKAKRDLADAIITADNSIISSMGREELEMLLS